MILLFTDFGSKDFYVGQVRSVISAHAPAVLVVDLLNELANFEVQAAAHLLAALSLRFQIGDVCLAVVDPGVGSSRGAVVMLADEKWYVGPDNGLFSVVADRASNIDVWNITWRPEDLCNTFHGRDIFAPIAAWIGSGAFPHGKLSDLAALEVKLDTSDLAEIIYIDHYGNAITGLRAGCLTPKAALEVNGVTISYSPVFSDVPFGSAFWYENSIGLIEIAVNRGSASLQFGLSAGDPVRVVS